MESNADEGQLAFIESGPCAPGTTCTSLYRWGCEQLDGSVGVLAGSWPTQHSCPLPHGIWGRIGSTLVVDCRLGQQGCECCIPAWPGNSLWMDGMACNMAGAPIVRLHDRRESRTNPAMVLWPKLSTCRFRVAGRRIAVSDVGHKGQLRNAAGPYCRAASRAPRRSWYLNLYPALSSFSGSTR